MPSGPQVHSSQPVRRVLSYFRSGDHLSRTTVADGLKQPTRRHRTGNSLRLLLGLAPDGVYQADAVARNAGELLPHLFTLTAYAAVSFLWHFPAGHPGWLLATTLPYGARTFLET